MIRFVTAVALSLSALAFTQTSFAEDTDSQRYKLVEQNYAAMERAHQANQQHIASTAQH
ncbi:hypothetical protein IQ22_00577 [Pseudomonas duriflava]|uniref:Secreted protein n=1 Tax=Pseudomonas duriflava TaxID=459528 RepID=A0A562QKU4_9PSED|nr:hypothetical protein [Pseudomonas duriflava]TWI57361.1 hypothetical protein IQ22_00577 [Pseudomonas duriflava]